MPKSSLKNAQKEIDGLTYEQALAELEEIVTALEGEQNQLDDAIKLFERGQALAAHDKPMKFMCLYVQQNKHLFPRDWLPIRYIVCYITNG